MEHKSDEFRAQVIGYTYLDLVSEQRGTTLWNSDTFVKSMGGDGFLTAIAFSRLGGKSALSSMIGSDEFGKGFIEALEKENVTINTPLSNTSALRFTWFEKEGIPSKTTFQEEAFLNFPKNEPCLTIVFASYLQINRLLNEAKLKFKGEQIAFVLEETISENDPDFNDILELAAFADIVFSFGTRSSSFLSKLDEALKQRSPSSVIERHPGVFDIIHRLETGSMSIKNIFSFTCEHPLSCRLSQVSEPAKIPAFIASYTLAWCQKKDLEETKTFVSRVLSLSSNRSFTVDSLPFKKELVDKKSLKEVELIHSKMISKDFECLCFLTFDQTAHFDELARTLRRTSEEIAEFKELIYNAFIKTLAIKHAAVTGICVDNAHGKEILAKSLSLPFALMRTVDEETKIAFHNHPYSLMRSWPRKEIIKVLFNLKDGELPDGDLRWLKNFSLAVHETGHRFLIEIYDKEMEVREERVLATMQKIYEQRIYPALWKLQPSYDLKAWNHFEELLEAHDPHAGILILGDRLPIKQLARELKELKEKTHKIRGFAIGRSLWQTVAEHWFSKRISNEMVESEVAFNFRRLLRIWENPSDYHAEEFEERSLEHLKR